MTSEHEDNCAQKLNQPSLHSLSRYTHHKYDCPTSPISSRSSTVKLLFIFLSISWQDLFFVIKSLHLDAVFSLNPHRHIIIVISKPPGRPWWGQAGVFQPSLKPEPWHRSNWSFSTSSEKPHGCWRRCERESSASPGEWKRGERASTTTVKPFADCLKNTSQTSNHADWIAGWGSSLPVSAAAWTEKRDWKLVLE